MNTIRIFAVVACLLGCKLAMAGTTFTVSINAAKAKAAAADACSKAAVAAAGAATDALTVKLDGKLPTDLQLSVDGVGSVVVLAAGSSEASFPAAKYANNRMLVMNAGKKLCELMLDPPAGSGDAQASGAGGGKDPAPAPSPVEQRQFAGLDQQAREFLTSKHLQDHEVTRDTAFGRTLRIYHLPSGVPAFPLPRHISEKDDVEIWMVVPLEGKATVDVSSCDKVPATRVSGTYKAAKEALGRLESAERVQFGLEGYAKHLRCAGTLTYKIDLSYHGATASTTTSIAFDPVYRFEWGIGYTFDFARPRKLSLGDRPTADGGSEKFVIESKDYAGATPILALSINVCGTNPDDLTWCDRLLTPTLFLDPKRLTSGFGAGLLFRPFHGFGLLAGVSVFKSTELADGAMAAVGDTWSIAGDVPTKETFNRDGVGFVLGAIVSTDVFAELLKAD